MQKWNGHTPFVKGHKIRIGLYHTSESKIKMKESSLLRKERDGYINSPETRIKLKEKRTKQIMPKGKQHHNYGKHQTEKVKKKISESMIGKPKSEEWKIKRRLWKIPFNDSLIEVKIQNLLSQLHVEYFTHKYISDITHAYQCDILIPSTKTIIECDGCYWHGCRVCNKKINNFQEKQIEEDNFRTKELQEKGYKVIRLWEHDIKVMQLNDFERRI